MKNAPIPHYKLPAITLHWLIALLIIGLLALGLTMEDFPMPAKFTAIQFHKSVGLLVLMLVVVRVAYRFTNPAPMLPKGTPKWQVGLAHATHTFLYVLMFAMPISGWLMSDAAGYHPAFFGLQIVPTLVEQGNAWGKVFHETHEIGGNLFLFLLAMHVGAALFHHVWVKDDILRRMLPRSLAKRLPVVLLALAAWPVAAHAQTLATEWKIDPQTSRITWTAQFNRSPVEGTFSQWTAQVNFDEKDLAHSRVEITIDPASISSGDDSRDSTLKGPDFFNAVKFPQILYTSSHIKPVGLPSENRYVATGNLTLGDVTKPLALPFQLAITGQKAQATVDFTLSRAAFGIGKGQWQGNASIADLVKVHVVVNATR
jgi:cytochrome b561